MTQPPSSCGGPGARGPSALIFDRINGVLELVERALREQLVSESDVIISLGEHVLSSGGKRMRPALLILRSKLLLQLGRTDEAVKTLTDLVDADAPSRPQAAQALEAIVDSGQARPDADFALAGAPGQLFPKFKNCQ